MIHIVWYIFWYSNQVPKYQSKFCIYLSKEYFKKYQQKVSININDVGGEKKWSGTIKYMSDDTMIQCIKTKF